MPHISDKALQSFNAKSRTEMQKEKLCNLDKNHAVIAIVSEKQ